MTVLVPDHNLIDFRFNNRVPQIVTQLIQVHSITQENFGFESCFIGEHDFADIDVMQVFLVGTVFRKQFVGDYFVFPNILTQVVVDQRWLH